MALPPLATVNDLAAWVGQTIESADPRGEAVLSAASALVRGYTSQSWVDEHGDLVETVPDDVAAVVVQVAARAWLNPNPNLRNWNKGPFAEGYFDAASLGLHLTAADKDALAHYRNTGASTGLGTIGITRGDTGLDTVYVPTAPAPSGYPFPWYAADGF